MTDRERLKELVDKAKEEYANDITDHTETDYIVETLLNEGAIVPPCKVGDTVYVISRYYTGDWEVYKCEIDTITIYKNNTFISCVAIDVRFGKIIFGLNVSEIGKTVFLTKEEAEAELKKRGKNNA